MAITIASFAQWKTLASDGTGDGSTGGPQYLDGTQLEYQYDEVSDSIWFRVTVNNVLNANYGINIIMNVKGAGATDNWFGTNSAFAYNRIITAWITSGTNGTVGVTDAAGFKAMNYKKLGSNNIDIAIDATAKTYTLGMKRTDIYNDTVLDATVIAGVGSNQFWDDDVPNTGSGSINAKPLSIQSISAIEAGYKIYPNPVREVLNIRRNESNDDAHMSLYNNVGQRVFESGINKGVSGRSIDMGSYPKGIYFLRINTTKQSIVETIVH